jgi:hypothetical protein
MRVSEETILKFEISYSDAKKLSEELSNVDFTKRPTFKAFYYLLPEYVDKK